MRRSTSQCAQWSRAESSDSGRRRNQPGTCRADRKNQGGRRSSIARRAATSRPTARARDCVPRGRSWACFGRDTPVLGLQGHNLIQQEILGQPMNVGRVQVDAGLKVLSTTVAREWRVRGHREHWQDYRFGRREERRRGAAARRARGLVDRERAALGSIAAFPPRTTSSGRGKSRSTSATTGTARTATRRSPYYPAGRHIRRISEEAGRTLRALQRPTSNRNPAHDVVPLPDVGLRAGRVSVGAPPHPWRSLTRPLQGNGLSHLTRDWARPAACDADIPDLVALKALAITIVSADSIRYGGRRRCHPGGAVYPGARPVLPRETMRRRLAPAGGRGRGLEDAVRAPAGRRHRWPRHRGGDPLQVRYNSIEGARRHSESNFLVSRTGNYGVRWAAIAESALLPMLSTGQAAAREVNHLRLRN